MLLSWCRARSWRTSQCEPTAKRQHILCLFSVRMLLNHFVKFNYSQLGSYSFANVFHSFGRIELSNGVYGTASRLRWWRLVCSVWVLHSIYEYAPTYSAASKDRATAHNILTASRPKAGQISVWQTGKCIHATHAISLNAIRHKRNSTIKVHAKANFVIGLCARTPDGGWCNEIEFIISKRNEQLNASTAIEVKIAEEVPLGIVMSSRCGHYVVPYCPTIVNLLEIIMRNSLCLAREQRYKLNYCMFFASFTSRREHLVRRIGLCDYTWSQQVQNVAAPVCRRRKRWAMSRVMNYDVRDEYS